MLQVKKKIQYCVCRYPGNTRNVFLVLQMLVEEGCEPSYSSYKGGVLDLNKGYVILNVLEGGMYVKETIE